MSTQRWMLSQVVPDTVVKVPFDDDILFITPELIERACRAAEVAACLSGLARPVFGETVIAELALQIADVVGADPLGGANLFGEADLDVVRAELRDDPGVRAALEELWDPSGPDCLRIHD